MRILVGTSNGLFTAAGNGPAVLEGRDVTAVTGRDGELWAVVDQHSLWRSDDGRAWEPATMIEERRLNCLLSLGDSLLIGTSEAHLFLLEAGEVDELSSFEDAPGRSDWFTPWGGPPDVRSLSRGPSGDVFVNVHVGGILRSEDLDRWTPTLEIGSDVHQVLATERAVFAASAWGLGVSRDAGASWSFESDGLHATYARAVAVCDSTLLMSASEGPRGRRSALYRRDSEEAGFVKAGDGLPDWFGHNVDTGCLAATESLVAFATEDGDVFLSEDCGRSWRVLADDLPPASSVLIVA